MSIRSLAVVCVCAALAAAQSPKLGVGRTPTEQEIRALGVTVAPDGAGLPPGSGSAVEGRAIFAQHCAKCHGEKGAGDVGPPLVADRAHLRPPGRSRPWVASGRMPPACGTT